MRTFLIVAVSADRFFLPWPPLKRDLDRLRRIAPGHVVITDRKTHESILHCNRGAPLKGVTTVVMTSNPGYRAPGCTIITPLEAAIDFARSLKAKKVFFVGEEDIYWQAVFRADTILTTFTDIVLEGTLEKGSGARFLPLPPPPEDAWIQTKAKFHEPSNCTFTVWQRKGAA